MKTIAHLSDLHFGAEDPPVAQALAAHLKRLFPSIVIVSGDLTQRARQRQFAAARAFLNCLPQPQLIVPGNHDIPLYDVLRRFLRPLVRYRRHISPELNPFFSDGELAVLGINTARSLTWKSGRISPRQIELIRAAFLRLPEPAFKIIVTHHPILPPPGDAAAGVDLLGRAAVALPVMEQCGVDLLLAGHLHHGYTGDVRTYYPGTRRSIVVAQAGTATSHRLRKEPNAFNWIRVDRSHLSICVRVWDGTEFRDSRTICYACVEGHWERQQDARDP